MSAARACVGIDALPATPLSHVAVGPGPEALRLLLTEDLPLHGNAS
jgi:hypothetical protein